MYIARQGGAHLGTCPTNFGLCTKLCTKFSEYFQYLDTTCLLTHPVASIYVQIKLL